MHQADNPSHQTPDNQANGPHAPDDCPWSGLARAGHECIRQMVSLILSRIISANGEL